MDRVYAGAYLRGLFDGEGTVQLLRKDESSAPFLRRISICNTDLSILDHAAECLTALGIEFRTHQRNPRERPGREHHAIGWDIVIYGRRNIVLFCRYVGSSSDRKSAKLRDLRVSYSRGKRRYGRFYSGPRYDDLVKRYERLKSISAVARELGVTHEVIRRALHKGGHPIMHYSASEMAQRRWHP